MRHCPKCNREFEDDLQFCMDDGTFLVSAGIAPTVEAPTAVLPATEAPPPTLAQAARPDVPGPPQPLATARTSAGSRSMPGSSRTAITIGILLGGVLILCFAGFGLWGITFARRTPMVLLCLAGMAFAMVRAKIHPTASLTAGFGLSVYLFSSFIFSAAIYNLPSMTQAFRVPYATLYIVFSLLDYFAYAIVIVLLVAAAFAGRDSRSAVNN